MKSYSEYRNYHRSAWCAALLLITGLSAQADTVAVAVAANFQAPMEEISKAFEKDSGHSVAMSTGSSGKFVAQIQNGAPFDVFLSADQQNPIALEGSGHAVTGTRFTYAEGALVLWSAKVAIDPQQVLKSGDYNKLAIANPKLAPYGLAATQVLDKMGLTSATTAHLVTGENIAQTWQFIGTGNADIGFVALSQVRATGDGGSSWIVPSDLYEPIRQDAVLLKRGEDNNAAKALLDYLHGTTASTIIQRYGYGLGH
ncbi:molybdate ABC transporter substrate-binding protein [Parathalassolituus penaei]|uniref:Molybdate ABC transporter substrate-binding protein n=1 Tax=Parathalassolituus penaei TaxID=2997323 RepID=A0A9X3IS66_9GAMM|nr:molybdate ABC transporter substrate-binding protein [Parathalassolituus penaei]MCY0963833.1 molybdate ABC transporter substrate-binding protein [Parathalassolituus penaei]